MAIDLERDASHGDRADSEPTAAEPRDSRISVMAWLLDVGQVVARRLRPMSPTTLGR